MRVFGHYKRNIFILLISLVIFVSCEKDNGFDIISKDPNVIIVSTQHLAFPDLIYYDNYWYVTFRMSDAHLEGSYSKIIVMKSPDFINWEKINEYEYSGFDLRDPRFSYNDVSNSLYLHFMAVNRDKTNLQRINKYIKFNCEEGFFVDDITINAIRMPEQYTNDWLWRPVWEKGAMFAGGYSSGNLRFYKYDNLYSTPRIFSRLYGLSASESTLRFYNRNLYTITRTNKNVLFGIIHEVDSTLFLDSESEIEYKWISLPFEQFGGPNMIVIDDIMIFGGRVNDKTQIYKYSFQNNNIELLVDLLSYGIDNAYPGFFLLNNKIYGVYYSQTENHDGFMIRSFILQL